MPLAWHLHGAGGATLPGFAASAYDGVIRSALLEYKERGRLCLRFDLAGRLLVALLGAATTTGGGDTLSTRSLLLVPVPSAAATRRTRGHDPVGALATLAARQLRDLGVNARTVRALQHARSVDDQAGLDIGAAGATSQERLQYRDQRACMVGTSSWSTTSSRPAQLR